LQPPSRPEVTQALPGKSARFTPAAPRSFRRVKYTGACFRWQQKSTRFFCFLWQRRVVQCLIP